MSIDSLKFAEPLWRSDGQRGQPRRSAVDAAFAQNGGHRGDRRQGLLGEGSVWRKALGACPSWPSRGARRL